MSKIDEILAQTSWAGTEPKTDSNIFAEEGTLKKADLKTGPRASVIRNYMQDRFGDDYRVNGKIDDDAMVEDFFNHMRGFNTNLLSTSKEVRYVSNASDAQKSRADAAFRLYDQTGSVFTNDGFFGAVDGVADYIGAAATDPSNYIGLLTGGWAKAGGLAASAGAKGTIRAALKEAGKNAIKDPKNLQAVAKEGMDSKSRILAQMAANGVKSPQAKEAAKKAATQEALIFRKKLVRDAMRKEQAEIGKARSRKAIMATTAIDGTLAALNDYQIQSVYGEIRPEYQYSVGQTAFSSLFGTVAGGAQLVGGAFKGASNLSGATDGLKEAALRTKAMAEVDKVTAKEGKILSDDLQKQASAAVMKDVTSWAEKVKGKANYFDDVEQMPVDLLRTLVLGPNGNGVGGGLISFYKKAEAEGSVARLSKNHQISDVMTNILERMPEADIIQMNKLLQQSGMHIKVGELGSLPNPIRDLIAGTTSDAGKTLNVWSQARRLVDASLLRTDDVLADMTAGVAEREADVAKRFKGLQYGQNLWRRMLVSSVSTTAVNVAGFAQYYVGSTLADVLSGGAMMAASVVTPGKKGAEMRRMGKIYMNTVAEKARHLMDPYTTHDTYMKFLKENKDVSKVLFETVTGGVERTAKRYGVDDTKEWYKVAEAIANGASKLTGVRIQDSFTKSQMFMTEMDKYLKLKHDISFADALKQGKTDLIDDDVIGSALDTTMKSVYSKDYTTDDQLLGAVAKQVEEFSNLPLIGTILPFGRFMNNTVATAYQWSVGGGVEVMSAIVKKEKRNISTVEAAARSIVGVSALGMAMRFDEQQMEADRPYYMIDGGAGDLIDVKNLFPFSAWAAVGRAANLARQGEPIPAEIIKDIGAQLAVGQFASDVQFGNDLYAVLGAFTSGDEEAVGVTLDALYQKTGSIVAGFTRPLDALNRMAGYVNNTDAARDPRQATGTTRMSLEATKYVDNLIEMVTDKLDGVTGEELRVALREGSLHEPAPLHRLFGVKIVPARTSAEITYGTAEFHNYMANMRTKVPEYDKLYAEIVAPILEQRSRLLLSDPKFMEGNLDTQRKMVRELKAEIKKDFDNILDVGGVEQQSLKLRKKLTTYGPADSRRRAKERMQEMGVEGPMSEWTYQDLKMYEALIDSDKEFY